MKTNTEESNILARMAKGETPAFDDCVKQYGKLVWALARKFTPRHEDAEDAVQEIMTEIWLNASRYDSAKAAESTFISTIARRRLIDRLRKSYRRPVAVSIDDVLEVPRRTGFEESLNNRIEAERATRAMKDLRREQRELIFLSVFEGLSHGEIGQRVGMPLGTVKTHIRRGLGRVRQSLSLGA